jgi:hypothetical protein
VHGELLKLGIDIGEAGLMVRHVDVVGPELPP